MRKLLALTALAIASIVGGAQTPVIGPTPVTVPTAVTGLTGSGPTSGTFNDFFTPAGTFSGNIGSPSGQVNNGTDGQVFGHPGLWNQTSGTVSGAGVYMVLSTAGRAVNQLNGAGNVWVYETDVQVQTLPGTTAASYQEGITSTLGVTIPWTTATTAASFLLSSANGVPNDWYCTAGATVIDSGVAATTSYVRLTIYADGTTVHYAINGKEAVGCRVAQSGIFSGANYLATSTQAGTTSSVTKVIDYVSFYEQPTR